MRESGGPILIVVPARGGSRGLPGKNLATVAGVSLVARAVVRGREFVAREDLGERAEVVIDTDDPAIAEEARLWGAMVPGLRPSDLAADTTPTSDSLSHLIGRVEQRPETVILLQPTSPLARASDVTDCWVRYGSCESPSVVTTVETAHPPALALVEDDDGLLTFWTGTPPEEVRRQGNPTACWPSGAVYVVDADWFRANRTFISSGLTVGVPVDPARAVDVDDRQDLRRARLEALHSSDVPIPEPDLDPDVVVEGGPTTRETAERVLERLAGGGPVRAVRVTAHGRTAMDTLGQVPAIRSMFGLPVLWDTRGSSPDATRMARMFGARVEGPTPTASDTGDPIPEWFDRLRDR